MTPNRLRIGELHWGLISVVGLIVLLGVYNLHSAAAAREPHLYLTQVYWVTIAGVLAAVMMWADYRITEGLAYPFYLAMCLVLLAVLFKGAAKGGAQRWLVIGPMQFQPSEVAKLAVVFCLARYFSVRDVPGGYTLGSLFRPLNPSRPLAATTVLLVFWGSPWLVDPIGSLARMVREKLAGNVPEVGELLWFRLILLIGVVLMCVFWSVVVIRLERQNALLHGWPRGRRNQLIAAIAAVGLVLVGLLAWNWHTEVMRDPFGVAIQWLYDSAAPGGRYDDVSSSIGLRLLLVLAVGAYLLASFMWVRQRGDELTDVLVAPIDLLLLPTLLVLVQPDLGTAGILVLIGMTMILVVGVKLRSLVILGAMGALLAVVGWFGILKDYQKRRILTFIDPEHDIKGAGWNAVQSMIAVGSGRWWGKGHKEGTQTQLSFLPEQHTDFAFSVWAEEQGFLGSLLLLGLYLLLLLIALSIAADARERYGALLATGIAALILWQTLINVGMVIGIFPVVGLTLPLFSYGGSSLLTVVLGLGLLLNIHWRRHTH